MAIPPSASSHDTTVFVYHPSETHSKRVRDLHPVVLTKRVDRPNVVPTTGVAANTVVFPSLVVIPPVPKPGGALDKPEPLTDIVSANCHIAPVAVVPSLARVAPTSRVATVGRSA